MNHVVLGGRRVDRHAANRILGFRGVTHGRRWLVIVMLRMHAERPEHYTLWGYLWIGTGNVKESDGGPAIGGLLLRAHDGDRSPTGGWWVRFERLAVLDHQIGRAVAAGTPGPAFPECVNGIVPTSLAIGSKTCLIYRHPEKILSCRCIIGHGQEFEYGGAAQPAEYR